MRSSVHSCALQVLNTNSLKALLNTGGLKICFNSNTCLYSLLNQNQTPVYWRSLNFMIKNYARENEVSLSFPATTTKAYKAIKGHKQEEKQGQDFYLSLNHGRVQRKKKQKNLSFSLLFPHLAVQLAVCCSIQIRLSHFQKWFHQGNSCLSWGCS